MRLTSLILYFVAGASLVAAPVNFKVATLVDARPESLDRPRPYITAGTRKICFAQPPFCDVSSDPESLTVYLAKPGMSGQFTVTNSSFKTDADFTARVEEYHKAAQASIPSEAKDIEYKGSNDHLYFVNDFKSLALDFTYTLMGRTMRRQVAYINIDGEHQVCLTILCDEESTAATYATAKRFVNSWFWADGVPGALR